MSGAPERPAATDGARGGTMSSTHLDDPHLIGRSGWLRAAVLGANDGVISVSSLIVGVAASAAGTGVVVTTAVAGLVAGAMSMAAGEYVSVSSQSDIERADIERERRALVADPEGELEELAQIHEQRGLSAATARRVAEELTEHDALTAHTRDEIGLSQELAANPLTAALTSAATFSVAASIPVLATLLAPVGTIVPTVLVTTVATLAGLGALGARAGGAPLLPATVRVVAWGIAAMSATASVGWLFGISGL